APPASRPWPPTSAPAARSCAGGTTSIRPWATAACSPTSPRPSRPRPRSARCCATAHGVSASAASCRNGSSATTISTSSTPPMPRSIAGTATRRRARWRDDDGGASTQRIEQQMAGIGFALERLYRSGSLADRVASFAHASVIAAGPCLLTVLCIWLISATISELEGRTIIAAFRALIIYSFALSFVITAPIALVSAPLISDQLHDREVVAIPGAMLAAFVLSAVVTVAAAAALFGLALDLDAAASVAAVANCALIALVWVACLFCSVTRDYLVVTAFFALGM